MRILFICISISLIFLVWAGIAQIAQTNIGSTYRNSPSQTSEKKVSVQLDGGKKQNLQIIRKKEQIDDCKDTAARLSEIENDSSYNISKLTFFKSNDSFPNIIKILGSCRTTASVPFLVKIKGKVALEQVNSLSIRGERVPVFDYFFAARAMVNIGTASIEPVLTELTNDIDYPDLDIQLNALILKEIYGEQVSASVLNEISSRDLSPKSTRKITIAKEVLERYDSFTWGFNGKTLSPIESRVELKKKLAIKN